MSKFEASRKLQVHGNLASRGRWAVATLFFVNGFLVGSWAPQIPLVLGRLSISETTLGLLILVFGLGAFVAMPSAGLAMSRYGSRRVLRVVALVACAGLVPVVAATDVIAVAVALFVFGASIGAMDVAMNTNAVVVERRLGRAVMSSSHGFWSLGGFAGGGLGGLAILHFGHLAHASLASLAAFAMALVALRHVIADDQVAPGKRQRLSLPSGAAVYLVGFIALFSMIPEGAVLDWAAIYLRQELDTDIATAGLAFSAFSAAMAVMRFVGDSVRSRFGAVTTLRVSSLVAAAGMLTGGIASAPWLVVAGFAISGFGIANMVPIAFSAAGNQPGLSSSAGMSVVTTMGYSGILLAPSAIGFIGERTGFAPIFVALSGLLVLVCLMAELARSADFTTPQPAE